MLNEANATQYECPHCRQAIALDDVNVATDVALCRSCGRTSAFSALCGAREIASANLDAPPRGIRVGRGFRGQTEIIYHRISPLLLFLVPFPALWSGVSMSGIYGTQLMKGRFDLAQSLFGLPFLLGTIVLLSAIAYMAFGKWVISLDRGQGSVFVGVGGIGWRRRFSYNRTTVVTLRETSIRVNHVRQQGICIQTDGEDDLVFGAVLKEEAKRYIAAAIMREKELGAVASSRSRSLLS